MIINHFSKTLFWFFTSSLLRLIAKNYPSYFLKRFSRYGECSNILQRSPQVESHFSTGDLYHVENEITFSFARGDRCVAALFNRIRSRLHAFSASNVSPSAFSQNESHIPTRRDLFLWSGRTHFRNYSSRPVRSAGTSFSRTEIGR